MYCLMNANTKAFSTVAAAVLVSALVFASFAMAKSYAQINTDQSSSANQTGASLMGNQTASSMTNGNQTGAAPGNQTIPSATAGNQTAGPSSGTQAQKPVDRMTGRIANIQNDNGKPTWIQAGIWMLKTKEKSGSESGGNVTAGGNATAGNQTSVAGGSSNTGMIAAGNTNLDFIAKFEMVQLNGSAAHEHNVTNLKASDVTFENKTLTVKGTATVTMKNGPVEGVPVTIRIINNAVLALTIGPDKVNSHFGTEPIYGTVVMERT
jgi:hypothetical protein